MLDKLKNNPFVSIVIVCSVVIPMAVGVTAWFYDRKTENIISKCEADKANLRLYYDSQLNKLEQLVDELKKKKTTVKPSSNNIRQNSSAEKSPNIVSEGDVQIEFK